MSVVNNSFAVIDLGSNSFHMMVVDNIGGTPRIISKVKRKVRLASGLDESNTLSLDAMERGWECLAWFGEHLSQLNINHVKVVATATLRLATNANDFCLRGNKLLGTPINIISGDQEAALIYHGMAVTSGGHGNRLIIDIGGASTELILGSGVTPLVLNSLNMGCVTWLEYYFADDCLTQQNFSTAIAASKAVIAPVKDDYLAHTWQLTLGASGSVQAVQEVLIAQGFNEEVTLVKLLQLKAQCIKCGHQDALNLMGLAPERRVVFVSGLCILIALFEALNIDGMLASGGALREGVIHQLTEEVLSNDLCLSTCHSIMQRFQINETQADNVARVAMLFAQKISLAAQVLPYLKYSALLHELGVSIEYVNAPQHARYLLEHLPLAGFSQQQRKLLIALVGNYKGDIEPTLLNEQGCCDASVARELLLCLRLAVICTGRYQGDRCDGIALMREGDHIKLQLTNELIAESPLMMTQLKREVANNSLLL